MIRKEYPIQSELKKLLDYDPVTGKFTWKIRTKEQFNQKRTCGDSCLTFNTRFAGKETGCNRQGYLVIRIKNVLYRANRLAYIYVYGNVQSDDVDHINRNTLDNSIKNLRSVSRSENMQNNGIQKNSTSGIRGISFHKLLNKWHSYIKLNQKRIHLGVYENFKDAVQARYNAEIKYGFIDFNPESSAYKYLQEAQNA